MRTLTCQRCGDGIASVEDRARDLIPSSLCERCSHPAYYRARGALPLGL